MSEHVQFDEGGGIHQTSRPRVSGMAGWLMRNSRGAINTPAQAEVTLLVAAVVIIIVAILIYAVGGTNEKKSGSPPGMTNAASNPTR